MYKALDIAKYIVTKCVKDGHCVSNLQLQKILYYIQEYYLKKKGTPIFDDEMQAWAYGPVVPNVYYYFCAFGSVAITVTYDGIENAIDEEDKDCMDAIIEEKRAMKIGDLISDVHKPDGAWASTYRDGAGKKSVISHDSIRGAA